METSHKSVRILTLGILGLALLLEDHSTAATFFVSNTNDTTSITSLRGAIIAANRVGGNNTIVLRRPLSGQGNQTHQWTYWLTIQGSSGNASQTGDLNILRGSLTIVGFGSNVTINASRLLDRPFRVMQNARLTLLNLTITGGTASAPGEQGGGIYNSGNLVIDHCAIVDNASGPNGDETGETLGNGGGIFNDGFLLVENSVLSNNVAGSDAHGGAIYNLGTATLNQCVIVSNSAGPDDASMKFGFAGGNGGGICNLRMMTLTDCIIADNTSGPGGTGGLWGTVVAGTPEFGNPGGNGGGIWNSGNLTLSSCTISGNISGKGAAGGQGDYGGRAGAGGDGGGLFNLGVMSLTLCTISSNLCGNGGNGGYGWYGSGGDGADGGNGGGIYNSGMLKLTSCTVAINQTGAGGNGGNSQNAKSVSVGGLGGDGGGVLNDTTATNTIVRDTIIALNAPNAGGAGGTNSTDSEETIGNAGSNGFGFDLVGAFLSHGFNLIGSGDGGTGFTNGITADQAGSTSEPIDPLIGPLQLNGGFTPTHALLRGSPAIDKGYCFGAHTDQRGQRRPHDYPTVSNAKGGDGSDIGAFESDTR